MHRAALVGVIVFVLGGSVAAHGSVVPPHELTFAQAQALERSEQRLKVYDEALQAIDVARKKHRISRQEYTYEEHDLLAFIAGEARYQNDIMIKNGPFPPESVREVMDNIAKYTVMTAEYIGEVALKVMPGIAGSH